jgi:outer membrane receptor protein involved in Fe transport
MIKRCSQKAAALVCAALLAFGWAGGAQAQGVTTGAIGGTVTNAAGAPVANATVTARNTATGFTRGARSDAQGRYFIPNLLPGTAYSVSASIIGQAPQQRSGLTVVLSQTTTVNFRLADQAVALEGLTVRAQNNPEISRSRTGASTTLSSETVTDIPKLNRSFNEVAAASPYVVVTPGQGPSIAGSNNRYNNIQIDGATTSDIFGLGSSGTPGGQGTSSKPVPIDAIDQFQVLVTPFDVRQTNFTGGLINAVTKSGTNRFRGNGFFTFRDEGLVQGDTIRAGGRDFAPPTSFYTRQFGATFGGPIIRDRLHFFLAGEVEQSERPGTFDLNSNATTIRVLPSRVDSVIAISQRLYGINPGTANVFTEEERLGSFLGRLDFRINQSNRLVLRHNSSPKWRDDEGLSRGGSNFDLSSYNFYYRTMNNSSVLQLFSDIGSRVSNELQVNYQTISDRPTPNVRYATVNVNTRDALVPGSTALTNGNIRFGSETSRHANELDQRIVQITNNLTFDAGAHRITAGVGLDYYHFRNLFLQGALGAYTFLNVDSLRVGRANTYTINVPLRDDIAAVFDVAQPGVYVQDVWSVTDNLDLSFGLRADMPRFLDEPARNELFFRSFGADNSQMPKNSVLFSPRFGFNYQAGGESTTQLRGGVGVFTGRPPFVWLSNAFSNTGNDFVTLTCRRQDNNVPAFTPLQAPTRCSDNVDPALSGAQLVNYTDADFKYPQELKATLGIDRELPFGITGTAEVIASRGLNALVTAERNLRGALPVQATCTSTAANPCVAESAVRGLGPREIYGTAQLEGGNNPRYAFNPVRVNNAFRNVVELTNESHTTAFVGLLQLARRFGRDYNLQASYTYTDAQEPISQTSSTATSNIGFHPIGARINDFSLARSAFVRPHKITMVGTANLFPRFGGTELSAIYVGQSGRPYTYTYDGDINGDGYESDAPGIGGRNNDLVYVPNDLSEIAFVSDEDRRLFNELVEMEPCLREARGSILERNTCTGPWVNRLDATIRQGLPGRNLSRFKIEANIFNLPNLLNRSWGRQQGPSNNTVTLLDYAGRVGNTANGAPTFTYDAFTETVSQGGTATFRRAVKPYTTFFESRYQIQIGLRADF